MADKKEIVEAIQAQLNVRKKRVMNRNAFDALLGAVTNPIGSLGRIFLGRDTALKVEEQRIAQDLIIDLLCRIDDALTAMNVAIDKEQIPRTIVSGLIEAHGEDVREVIGAQVEDPVEFKSGTHIRATGKGANSVTGLHVGKRDHSR